MGNQRVFHCVLLFLVLAFLLNKKDAVLWKMGKQTHKTIQSNVSVFLCVSRGFIILNNQMNSSHNGPSSNL